MLTREALIAALRRFRKAAMRPEAVEQGRQRMLVAVREKFGVDTEGTVEKVSGDKGER